jgi:hypothetical protein
MRPLKRRSWLGLNRPTGPWRPRSELGGLTGDWERPAWDRWQESRADRAPERLVEPLVALGNGHADLASELSDELLLHDLVNAGEAKGQLVSDRLIRRLEAAQS